MTDWGGTAIEPWVPIEGLALVEALKPALAAKQAAIAAQRAAMPAYLARMDAWLAATRAGLAGGTALSPAPAMPATADAGWSSMYNAMINPLVRCPIKGALWYQGESNGGEGDSYYDKMRALIGGWRTQWGQGDFPFYYVQLANFQAVTEDPAGGNGWARLREAQTKALTIPNTGMAVIIDTVPMSQSGDIHPKDKYDVGMRLARWALARDYGVKDLEALRSAVHLDDQRGRQDPPGLRPSRQRADDRQEGGQGARGRGQGGQAQALRHRRRRQEVGVGGRGDRERCGGGLLERGEGAGRGALRLCHEPLRRQPLQPRRPARVAVPHRCLVSAW